MKELMELAIVSKFFVKKNLFKTINKKNEVFKENIIRTKFLNNQKWHGLRLS